MNTPHAKVEARHSQLLRKLYFAEDQEEAQEQLLADFEAQVTAELRAELLRVEAANKELIGTDSVELEAERLLVKTTQQHYEMSMGRERELRAELANIRTALGCEAEENTFNRIARLHKDIIRLDVESAGYGRMATQYKQRAEKAEGELATVNERAEFAERVLKAKIDSDNAELTTLREDKARLDCLDKLLTDEHGFSFTVRWDNDQDTVAIVDGLGNAIAPATSGPNSLEGIELLEEDPDGLVFRAAIDAARKGMI